MLSVKGNLFEIYDSVQVSEKFRKREFVLEYADGQYPQYVKFELAPERCELIDDYAVGDEVEVFFDLRGRAWTNREGVKNYFNSLNCWKIQAEGAPKSAAKGPVANVANGKGKPGASGNAADGDDGLPF